MSPIADTVATAVSDLKQRPDLLFIVLLNMAFIGAGAWVISMEETNRANDRNAMMSMIEKCALNTVPVSYIDKPKKE